MRLIDLTKAYENLLYKLETDEDFDLEEALDDSADALEAKLESCAWMYRNLELEADAFKAEAKRFADKAKSREAAAERLKRYISYCLRCEPLKTKNFSFTFRQSDQVEVIDPDSIPEHYKRVKTVIEPDKEKIKRDLKSGIEIPFCGLLKNYNLQIK